MIVKSLLVLTVSVCVLSQQGSDPPAPPASPTGAPQDWRAELATTIARALVTFIDLVDDITQDGTTRVPQTQANDNAQSGVQSRALDALGGAQEGITQIQNVVNRVQQGLQVGQNAADRAEQRLTGNPAGEGNQQTEQTQEGNQQQTAVQQNTDQQVITQQVIVEGQSPDQTVEQRRLAGGETLEGGSENLQNQQTRVTRDTDIDRESLRSKVDRRGIGNRGLGSRGNRQNEGRGWGIGNGRRNWNDGSISEQVRSPRDLGADDLANRGSLRSSVGQRGGVRDGTWGGVTNRGLGGGQNRGSGRNWNDGNLNEQVRIPRDLADDELASRGRLRSNVGQWNANNNRRVGNDKQNVGVGDWNDGNRGQDSLGGSDRRGQTLNAWGSDEQQRAAGNRGDGKPRNPRGADGAGDRTSDWGVNGRGGRGGRDGSRGGSFGRGGRQGSKSL